MKTNDLIKEKELKHDDVINFIGSDKSFGNAEFIICPVWKHRKIKRFFIFHAQQRNVKYFYRVECGYSDSFQVSSYVKNYLNEYNEPRIWLNFWCKEHKCQSMRIYVPRLSNSFRVQVLSTAGINFTVKDGLL